MGARFKAANVSADNRTAQDVSAGDDGALGHPPRRLDRPSTNEIRAYYHSPDMLSRDRLAEIGRFVDSHSIDDKQVRLDYLAERDRTERELAEKLDEVLDSLGNER